MEKRDIVIVGAGPAGSSAAFFLSRLGLDVLLLEKNRMPRSKPCGDGIGPRAVLMLEEMGLSKWLNENHFFRIERMRLISQSGQTIISDTSGYDFPTPYGYVIRRDVFDKSLVDRAVEVGATFREGFKVKSFLFDRGRGFGVVGEADKEEVHISANLMILADGSTGSLSRRLVDIKKENQAIAYRGYADFNEELDNSVNIYFSDALPKGYGWIFPLSNKSANVGIGSLGMKKDKIDLKGAFKDFIDTTKIPIDLKKGKFSDEHQGSVMRMSFGNVPLHLPGIAIVGDAAGLVSPINGEGISHAMESSALLSRLLEGNTDSYTSIDKALGQYSRQMRKEYYSYFRWARMLGLLLSNHKRLNNLIRKAEHDETLAHSLTGVLSNTIHPREFRRLDILKRILF